MSTRYDPPATVGRNHHNDDDLFDTLADENIAGESAAKQVMTDHHNQTAEQREQQQQSQSQEQQQPNPKPVLSDMAWPPILPDPQSILSTIVRPDALIEKGFDMVGAMLGDAPKMILSDHGPGTQPKKNPTTGSTIISKRTNNTKCIGVPTPYDPEKSVVPIDDYSRMVQQQPGGCVGLTWKAATASSGIPMYNCRAGQSVEMTLASEGGDDEDEDDEDDYTEDDSTISSFRPPPVHITLNMDDPLMQQHSLMEQQAKMLKRKKRRSGSPLIRRIGSSLRYGMGNNKGKNPNKVRAPVAKEVSVEEWLKMNAGKCNPKKTRKSRSKQIDESKNDHQSPSNQEQIDHMTGSSSKGKKGSKGSKTKKQTPDTPSTRSEEVRPINKVEARKKKREGVKEKKLLQKQMKEQLKAQKKSTDKHLSPKTKAPVKEALPVKETSKRLVGKPMQPTGRGRSMIQRGSDPLNGHSRSLERIPADEFQRGRSRSVDQRRTLPPQGHQPQMQQYHDVHRGRSRSLERRHYHPQEPELLRGRSKSMERRDYPTGRRDRSRSLSRREVGRDGYYDDVHRGRSRSLERRDQPVHRGRSQSMQRSLMYEYERLQPKMGEYMTDQPQMGKSRTKQSGEVKRGKSKGRMERQQSAPAPSKSNQRKPIPSKKSRPIRGRE